MASIRARCSTSLSTATSYTRCDTSVRAASSIPIMLLITRRLFATGLLLAPIGGIRFADAAPDATHITFILVNDIYLMADELMSDGQRRGGFARLVAVVKSERTKANATGGHVVFAHGGDTLSPSLMSGIDHGAHIVTLTNLIPPDIFVPGNHEFDFGKTTFLQRMAEAKFPLYAANLRGPDGQPLPNFKDRSIVSFDGVRIGLTGATYDDSVRASDPGDLRFLPTVATLNEQAAALRRAGDLLLKLELAADKKKQLMDAYLSLTAFPDVKPGLEGAQEARSQARDL